MDTVMVMGERVLPLLTNEISFLIYCKLDDPLVKRVLLQQLASISDKVYDMGDMIAICNSDIFERLPEDMALCVVDYFNLYDLTETEGVYLFYTYQGKIGVWSAKGSYFQRDIEGQITTRSLRKQNRTS